MVMTAFSGNVPITGESGVIVKGTPNFDSLSDEAISQLTRQFWGAYMYEACAERGHDFAAEQVQKNLYMLHAAEARRREINPFAGVLYPEHSWPADFYREAVERGEITTAKTL